MPRTVLVCEAQVPFVRGGAEAHVRELVRQLRAHGLRRRARQPARSSGIRRRKSCAHAAAWRLLDLSESNGRPIDLVIATKFPTYFARHPRKVAWLIHQHRAAYELAGTPFSDFAHTEDDVALRERLDRARHSDARRVPARLTPTRANTAARARAVQRPDGRAAVPSAAAAPAARRAGPSGDYVLSVGRLESVKRVDLAIRAMAHAPRAACRWSSPAPARSRDARSAGRVARRDRSRAVSRRSRRRRPHRALRGRARRRLSALTTRTTAT